MMAKKNFLTVLGHNQRDGIFLSATRQKSEEEEDSVMAALMKSTDEEIEKNSKLVRDDI